MTRRESAIIGAFTGTLVGPFNALHGYIEELMKRPVWTHELASKELSEEIKRRAKKDFMALCASVDEHEETKQETKETDDA
jgi:hypothetical protein